MPDEKKSEQPKAEAPAVAAAAAPGEKESRKERKARFAAQIAEGGSVLVGGVLYASLDEIPDSAYED